jgi:hypothetical protein
MVMSLMPPKPDERDQSGEDEQAHQKPATGTGAAGEGFFSRRHRVYSFNNISW